MPSGIKFNEKDNHFEAKYENPWGGVASDAAPMDIAPNQFTQCDGLIIKDGVLNSATIDYTQSGVTTVGASIALVFNISSVPYFIDIAGNIYITVPSGIGNTLYPRVILVSNSGCTFASCVKVINSIAYIFCYGTAQMFIFDPSGPSLTLGQNFVAGFYAMTVDEYLITAATNMPSDTPAKKANRVNWSSPDSFAVWDPSVDRTAGYNVLIDVQDYISALFAMGNVGYVLRSQGLTQMTPTGVGISPFDFTSVYASEIGNGCTFPGSFAQYGYVAGWMNDNGIYLFTSSGAPQDIAGSARTAIYKDITSNTLLPYSHVGFPPPQPNNKIGIIGSFSNNNISASSNAISTPNLEYTLMIVVPNGAVGYKVIFWTYNLGAKAWTRLQKVFLPTTTVSTIFPLSGGGIYTPVGSTINRLVPTFCVGMTIAGVQDSIVLSKYQASFTDQAAPPNGAPAIALTFRQEEIALARQPQVRGVAIKAQGVGTLNVTITGNINPTKYAQAPTTIVVNFTSVTLHSTAPVTVYSSGIFTGEDPQCSIDSTSFDGIIIKASMFGTYADGEPF